MSAHNNSYTHTPGQNGFGGRVYTKNWRELKRNDSRDLVGCSVCISTVTGCRAGLVVSHSVGGSYWVKLSPTRLGAPTVEVERVHIKMVLM